MIAQPASKITIFALAITMLGLLPGCSSTPATTQHGKRADQHAKIGPTVGQKAATIALDQVGVPYRYGGDSPNGFDCSGLVQYSYSRAGKNMPRTTGQLWAVTQTVSRKELRAGDLLFFSIEGKMSHVGLYLGDERFVHAPSSGRSVAVANLEAPYYDAAFLRAGRPR